MIYYFLLCVLSLLGLIHVFVTDKKQMFFISGVTVLFIIIIGGFRFEVGADWFAYNNLFVSLGSSADLLNSREEKLFLFTFYFLRFFTSNFSIAIFILFTISFFLKLMVMNQYSPNIFLSLVSYCSTIFLIYDLNGIRQGIALSIVLISITSIMERKFWQYLFVLIVAVFFHTSAIIFVPFYWIANMDISLKRMLTYSLIILFISIPLRLFVLSNPLFSFLLTTDSLMHYNSYLLDNGSNKSVEILSVAVFQRLLILGLLLYNYRKINANESLKRLLLNGCFVSFIVFILFSFSSEFAARLSFYFKSMELLIFPMIVAAQNRLYLKIVYSLIFIVLAFLATHRLLRVQDNGLVPYQFYFFID